MWAVATARIEGRPTACLVVGDRIYPLLDLDRSLPATVTDLFADWPTYATVLPGLAAAAPRSAGTGHDVATTELLAPLLYPGKVLCAGANYFDHMTQDGGQATFSKRENIPVFFLKPPTTTLVGQGRSVRYPVQSDKFDYELELAFVIGKRGRRVSPEAALDHVAGYTIGLDLSARDWQRHPKHLVKFDLFGGKAFDDSCPLGPGIVPARFVDPADLQLRLWVNGELRQDANTSDMIWPVPELVARLSEHVTLEPGDVVLTGTPAGVGLATNTWLGLGDVIDCEITGLGSMQIEIVPDADH